MMSDTTIHDGDYMCVMHAQKELDIRDIALPDSPYDAATALRVDISVVLVPGTVLLRYNPDELLFKDEEAELVFRRHVMSFFLRGGYRLANTITEREVLYIATSLQDREGYLISWADDLFFEPEEAKQLNQMLAEEIIKSSALILHP